MNNRDHVDLVCLESIRDLYHIPDGGQADCYVKSGLIAAVGNQWILTRLGRERLEHLSLCDNV